MKNIENKSLMLFKLEPTKFNELVNFIHLDTQSLVVLTSVETVTSGAVFQKKSSVEAVFGSLENAS